MEYGSDEEGGSDGGYYTEGGDGRVGGRLVAADSGVLVMYAPGGGPASRRSSVRHVVGV